MQEMRAAQIAHPNGPFEIVEREIRQLGAHHYIDSHAQDPAASLQKLGGARVILATVTNGDTISAVQGGDRGLACGTGSHFVTTTRNPLPLPARNE